MKTPLLRERDDVLINGIAPKHIRKFLQQIGGVTPWGENRYRLVLAECVMLYVGARWHDWAPNTDLLDQGGLDINMTEKEALDLSPAELQARMKAAKVKPNTPERTVEEMRTLPRYSDITGWMLQVWYPATYYSESHYAVTVTGRADLPLLGKFPAHGQYERQFFYFEKGLDGKMRKRETFAHQPGESWMQRAIEHNEREISKRSGNLDANSTEQKWRTMIAIQEVQKARETYEASQRREFEAQMKDQTNFLFSSTEAAGRIREEVAQRCRAKGVVMGHVGN